MGKSGFATTIPYGTELHDVTQEEYERWDTALGNCDGSPLAVEWATYDVLMGSGYFVTQPTTPRPQVVVEPRIPGPTSNASSRDFWEPEWTQSRILEERAKLQKEREKIFEIRQKALNEKIIDHMEYVKRNKTEPGELVNRILGTMILVFLIWYFFF